MFFPAQPVNARRGCVRSRVGVILTVTRFRNARIPYYLARSRLCTPGVLSLPPAYDPIEPERLFGVAWYGLASVNVLLLWPISPELPEYVVEPVALPQALGEELLPTGDELVWLRTPGVLSLPPAVDPIEPERLLGVG